MICLPANKHESLHTLGFDLPQSIEEDLWICRYAVRKAKGICIRSAAMLIQGLIASRTQDYVSSVLFNVPLCSTDHLVKSLLFECRLRWHELGEHWQNAGTYNLNCQGDLHLYLTKWRMP